MPRISVTLSDEVYKELEMQSQKNEGAISQCAKELIELGLRIKAAAEKNLDETTDESSLIDEIKAIKSMLLFNMTWALESRTYARYLIEHIPGNTKEKNIEIANLIKEKAKHNISTGEYIDKAKP